MCDERLVYEAVQKKVLHHSWSLFLIGIIIISLRLHLLFISSFERLQKKIRAYERGDLKINRFFRTLCTFALHNTTITRTCFSQLKIYLFRRA